MSRSYDWGDALVMNTKFVDDLFDVGNCGAVKLDASNLAVMSPTVLSKS